MRAQKPLWTSVSPLAQGGHWATPDQLFLAKLADYGSPYGAHPVRMCKVSNVTLRENFVFPSPLGTPSGEAGTTSQPVSIPQGTAARGKATPPSS